MGYVVRVNIGTGRNKLVSQSIVLPSKARVEQYIKRHPALKSNTKIRVRNLSEQKTISGTKGMFFKSYLTKKYRY